MSSITFLTNTTWHSSHHGLSARHLPVPRVDEPPRARSSCGFPLFVCSRVLSSCPSCDLTADASFSSPGVRSFSGPSSFLWAPSFRRLSRSRADTQSEVMHRVFVSHGPFSPFCGLPDDFGSALSESFSSCEHCLRLMSSSSGTFSFRRVLPSTIHRSFLSCDDPLLPAVILSFFPSLPHHGRPRPPRVTSLRVPLDLDSSIIFFPSCLYTFSSSSHQAAICSSVASSAVACALPATLSNPDPLWLPCRFRSSKCAWRIHSTRVFDAMGSSLERGGGVM